MLLNRVVQGRRGRGRLVTLALVCGTGLVVICVLLQTSRSALQGHVRSSRKAASSAASSSLHHKHEFSVIKLLKLDVAGHEQDKPLHQKSSFPLPAPEQGVPVISGEPWYNLHKSRGSSHSGSSHSGASVKLPLILHSSNFGAVVGHHVDPISGAVAISTFRGGIKPLELAFAMNQYVQFAGVGLVTNLVG